MYHDGRNVLISIKIFLKIYYRVIPDTSSFSRMT